MDNQPTYSTDGSTLPWYDDRVKTIGCAARNTSSNTDICDTPKKIYEYLDKHVWKQDAAKRDAAILAYNSFFREVKENAMFIGPTGCGKTHIWRCLQELFPDKIEIVDGSNITADGWKGDKKWNSPVPHHLCRRTGNPCHRRSGQNADPKILIQLRKRQSKHRIRRFKNDGRDYSGRKIRLCQLPGGHIKNQLCVVRRIF